MLNSTDLSELARHLRAVHFALLTLCMLALVSVTAGTDSAVHRARRQLRSIQTICGDWMKWSVQLLAQEWKSLRDNEPELRGITEQMSPSRVFVNPADIPNLRRVTNYGMELNFEPGILYLYVPRRSGDPLVLSRYDAPKFIHYEPQRSSPQTLAAFREFWNDAPEALIHAGTKLPDSVFVISGGKGPFEIPYKLQASPGNFYGIPLNYKQCTEKVREYFRSTLSSHKPGHGIDLLCGQYDSTTTLVFRVQTIDYPTPTNLQTWLGQKFEFQTTGDDFAETFPELQEIASHDYDSLPIETVAKILDNEIRRGGEKIQFLGLGIPGNILSRWGVIALVLIQFYLWRHLHTLCVSLSNNVQRLYVPWIGLYSDLWSRGAALATISFLPVLVSIRLLFSGSAGFVWWLVSAIGVFISVLSGALLWKVSTPSSDSITSAADTISNKGTVP